MASWYQEANYDAWMDLTQLEMELGNIYTLFEDHHATAMRVFSTQDIFHLMELRIVSLSEIRPYLRLAAANRSAKKCMDN